VFDEYATVASVEMLGYDAVAEEGFLELLPLLSCDTICCSAAVAVEESESDLGQVLIIGGDDVGGSYATTYPAVHKVDLATGCALHNLLSVQIAGISMVVRLRFSLQTPNRRGERIHFFKFCTMFGLQHTLLEHLLHRRQLAGNEQV
jgi:hypothetical protein